MFNIFVTDMLCLEERNSTLKEKVAVQQDTIQALGKDIISAEYYKKHLTYTHNITGMMDGFIMW